jgi:hypothetical protein
MNKRKTKSDSITIISDPLIAPFYISKDQHCYTIFENVDSPKGDSKQYQKAKGHYTDFGTCLKVIAQCKAEQKENFNTIKSYINEWTQIKNKIEQLIKI